MPHTQRKTKRRLPRPIEVSVQFVAVIVFGLIMASGTVERSLPDSSDDYILRFAYVIGIAIICCYVLPGVVRQTVFRFLRNRPESPE